MDKKNAIRITLFVFAKSFSILLNSDLFLCVRNDVSFEFCYSFLFLRFFLRTWHLAWKLISVPGNQKCFCIDNKNTTILSHSTIFVFKMTFLGFDYRDRYINISCKIIFPKWFLNKKMKIVSFFSVFGNSCDFFISLFLLSFQNPCFIYYKVNEYNIILFHSTTR